MQDNIKVSLCYRSASFVWDAQDKKDLPSVAWCSLETLRIETHSGPDGFFGGIIDGASILVLAICVLLGCDHGRGHNGPFLLIILFVSIIVRYRHGG